MTSDAPSILPPLPAETLAEKPSKISSDGRCVVVSIHDVSPLTRATTERILERLGELGVAACSLLVIPDHHRQGHFLDDPDFCAWLRERVAGGDEVVIHGYFHRRARRPNESARVRWTTRVYTADEGEFFDITGADALRLVSQAREEFRKIGLDPAGFIAPAWLLSEGGERALQKLGFDYTTRLREVIDLPSGRRIASQSLVWSVRSFWRRGMSRAWNASLYRRLRHAPLMRIGIHPVDLEHRAVWRQIETLIARAMADRTPLTYQQWIETSRPSVHAFQS